MNLANKLTILRIFLVPIFLIVIAFKDIPYGTTIATIIFVLASITDKLDGYIARSRNQITKFGKFMDPLADKLLVTSALIVLVEFRVIPNWAATIIIAREFAVSGLRTLAASDGIVIAASKWGKAKTFIQIVAIVSLLVQLNISLSPEWAAKVANNVYLSTFFSTGTTILLYLAVIITIISGVDYFIKNKNAINVNE
ncbi:CDP-diacylglycerol--glycerol-3-phosphate 3-phosphatidyltransferase [Inconstantimicrobium mannanitabidum]|uniref:CDP-diacylglycerol--glycerol-3-phosphate 3-phosphatidyltransferase n=1 Tax=Inconstantimicrobium mannanitabidum TaxID=1604901 RepID=A0ACB5RAV0_9CLOT|nr:CDP-diacylglycerol--glycerol-3-phosphate 3-phosphatidyltransferase [Clostridium sp. TW13]GKX66323.1 CDP-diacylglycerol--glycerol-3-phosphate 3-phosphatidyltransferase [Clostridium sp. TW13]